MTNPKPRPASANSARKQSKASAANVPRPLQPDKLDRQLINELQKDSRRSIRELGRKLGVSAPTVSDRLSRLERAGIIRGYSVDVSPQLLGFGILAYIGVFDTGQKFTELDQWAESNPAVLECHHLTGRFAAMIKVAVPDINTLNALVMDLIDLGVQCDTSIVLTSPVPRRHLNLEAAEGPS